MAPVVDLHAALVRIPSLSHEEHAAADLVEALARAAGLAVGRDDTATGGGNVWTSLGDDDGDVLLLASRRSRRRPSTGASTGAAPSTPRPAARRCSRR